MMSNKIFSHFTTKALRLGVVASLFLFSAPTYGFEGLCGIFEMKGTVRYEEGVSRLYLNEGSTSELTVTFAKHDLLPAEINGVPMHLGFEIKKSCRFHCKGHLLKVIDVLNPFQRLPPSPLGRIVPVQARKCL